MVTAKGPLCSSLLIALAVALASCGSVHQINNAIARSNGIAPDEAKQAAAQTLERIID